MRIAAALLLLVLSGCSRQPPVRQVVNLKEFMKATIEHNAEDIWDSVGTIITIEGTTEILPKTDDDWDHVRASAVTLAEASNLLLTGDRLKDTGDWVRMVHEMMDAAATAMKAAETRNPQALFDAGGKIYEACERCHEKYQPKK